MTFLYYFQEEEHSFFKKLREYRVEKDFPLCSFLNLDQTSVNLVMTEKKTIDMKGAKQVKIISPPGDKISYTVTLIIRADGEKAPAIILFKTASKDGTLPKKERKKFILPNNVIVEATSSGWWNNKIDLEIMKALFPKKITQPVVLV